MDPVACIKIINDTDEWMNTREDAVHDLAEWLHKGGAVPIDGGNISDQACEDLREFTGDIIPSIRVCIAYGDYSGLNYSF